MLLLLSAFITYTVDIVPEVLICSEGRAISGKILKFNLQFLSMLLRFST